MPYFEWKDEYSVGIRLIDDEHKELVNWINTLHEASQFADQGPTLQQVLQELSRYAATHFVVEEEMMRLYGYQGLAQHKSIHDSFAQKVATLNDELKRGELCIVDPVVNILKRWLENHILKVDRELGDYLVGLGIK